MRTFREYRWRIRPFEAVRLHHYVLIGSRNAERQQHRDRQSRNKSRPVHEAVSSAWIISGIAPITAGTRARLFYGRQTTLSHNHHPGKIIGMRSVPTVAAVKEIGTWPMNSF